jgi:hypothetical protein
MQSSNQVLRSDQKRLDEIKCLREALASGRPILTDQEKAEITKYALVLGKDWEVVAEELLAQVRESTNQPANIMRIIKDYISGLGKRAALHELSLYLEKEMAQERTMQLKTMEVKWRSLPGRDGRASLHGKKLKRRVGPGIGCPGTAVPR